MQSSCPFSPPTRGWPGNTLHEFVHAIVFPAHAGMARPEVSMRRLAKSFPRPRGDGPSTVMPLSEALEFSPPTRGWPDRPGTLPGPPRVFPAHAGMARVSVSGIRIGQRFPRPRGDGPTGAIPVSTQSRFSPPTRGWPGRRPLERAQRHVFPAHAGMARFLECLWDNPVGFPRPRGDGPCSMCSCYWQKRFSPPTRGWPGGRNLVPPLRAVFPAHAGMARSASLPSPASAGFPRPRGDGPSGNEPMDREAEFSPPTRGWPDESGSYLANDAVFPAHAGMAR